MTGFDAITYHNGWTMALTGVIIVFIGLILLSSAIAQLQKLVRIGGKNGPEEADKSTENDRSTNRFSVSIPDPFPLEINDAATIYQPLVEQLGDLFKLADLYSACSKAQIPHPHITISGFRRAGILVLQDNRLFSWNPPS